MCAPRGGGGRASPGGCLPLLRGASDVGAPPPMTARPLGGLLGSTTHVLWALACGCGSPTLSPWPACPVGAACRGGGGGPSPGGLAFHRCEGRLRSGAPPPPTARPLGGLLGSATHVLRARGCGCGGPSPFPTPACPVGAACRGGGGGSSPGVVACHRSEGRRVSGAVPPPAARPLGRVAGVPRPVRPGVKFISSPIRNAVKPLRIKGESFFLILFWVYGRPLGWRPRRSRQGGHLTPIKLTPFLAILWIFPWAQLHAFPGGR